MHAVQETNKPDDCVSLARFEPFKNSVTNLIQVAVPLLAAKLNRADWPELIGDAFKDGFSTSESMHELFKRNFEEFSSKELLLMFYWFFRSTKECSHGKSFIKRVMEEQNGNLLLWIFFTSESSLGMFIFAFAVGPEEGTFDGLFDRLLRPGADFDMFGAQRHRRMEYQVFASIMRSMAPIAREHPYRRDNLPSFILTKTIGVILNGDALGALLPSQLLPVENLLRSAFEVSEYYFVLNENVTDIVYFRSI